MKLNDSEYVAEVLQKLQDNPTAQDLDYLIEAHARVGYLAAVSQGRRDVSIAERKFAFSSAYADAKREGAKTAGDAENIAVIRSHDAYLAEARAGEVAAKLASLLSSIEQCINGIKYLGRQTDVSLPLTRR